MQYIANLVWLLSHLRFFPTAGRVDRNLGILYLGRNLILSSSYGIQVTICHGRQPYRDVLLLHKLEYIGRSGSRGLSPLRYGTFTFPFRNQCTLIYVPSVPGCQHEVSRYYLPLGLTAELHVFSLFLNFDFVVTNNSFGQFNNWISAICTFGVVYLPTY